uniref:Microtubule associated protein (Ase1) n=1 Tax=Cucumis sativus TaxID=3659 RepID=A0A0A0L054_CUCSA
MSPPSLKNHLQNHCSSFSSFNKPFSFLFSNFSMCHSKTMPFPGTRRILGSFGLWIVAFTLFSASSKAQMAVPSTGQLCISDCSTCPVICTAPPPPLSYIPPPPPNFYGGFNMAPPATPSYYLWGPPPPVANYFLGARPSGEMPQTVGPRDYSYPYYYFYSSNSGSFTYISKFIVLFVCLLHFVL